MDTTTGVLDMQDLGEPMTSDDCDTDLHGDQTAATTHTDDTAQMITRSMTARKPPQQDRALDADHRDSDTNDLTRDSRADSEQQQQQRSPANRRRADNDLNKTLNDFGQIDLSDLNDVLAAERDPVAVNEFKRAQRADPSLASLWTRAEGGSQEYRVINDTLYRVAPAYSTGTEENLLVVPAEYRNQLLRIAHDAQSSGHAGVRKTEQRLKALFY